eukprot:COSAG01_NODE_47035_length_394_cov_1.050847_2_plen_44_part_01
MSRPFVSPNRGWKRPGREAKLLRASKVSEWRWWDVCGLSCGALF